jgi:tRNA threonylcarbamoyladenosine biosynthesis protein TsaB
MPSLNQILATQAPLLLLDAASTRIQVGHFAGVGSARWAVSEEEAGIGVFRCVEALGLDLAAVRAFAFCHGPGSILGIRTVAMALRAWSAAESRPHYGYASLAVVAQALGQPGRPVIADARRDSWHLFELGGTLRRVPTAELPAQPVMPEGFRHWTPLPARVGRTSYDLAALWGRPEVAQADLLQPTAAPDAFLTEEPAYATWEPKLHRAP